MYVRRISAVFTARRRVVERAASRRETSSRDFLPGWADLMAGRHQTLRLLPPERAVPGRGASRLLAQVAVFRRGAGELERSCDARPTQATGGRTISDLSFRPQPGV